MSTHAPVPGGWVAIQRNPLSGAGGQSRHLWDLIEGLRRHGLRPRIFSRRERLSAWLHEPGNRERLVCLVAAGGDGTFRDVCERYPGLRVAILPVGTENLVARFLRIPRSGAALAAMIAAGHARRLDLGGAGERKFAIMASAGFDAQIIHAAHARRTGHISRLNYLQPIAGALRNYKHPDLRVWVDDEPLPRTCKLAVLVNLPVYALGLSVAEAASGDDGLFDLRLFQRGSAWEMMRYFYHLCMRGHERLGDVQTLRARRVRIEADTPIPLQVDGDPAGWTPVEFRILPLAVEVVVPSAD